MNIKQARQYYAKVHNDKDVKYILSLLPKRDQTIVQDWLGSDSKTLQDIASKHSISVTRARQISLQFIRRLPMKVDAKQLIEDPEFKASHCERDIKVIKWYSYYARSPKMVARQFKTPLEEAEKLYKPFQSKLNELRRLRESNDDDK